MHDKKSLKLLENGLRTEGKVKTQSRLMRANKRISDARMILYVLKVFIKLGALASDSNIIDDNLQLNKFNDDYYLLFRTLNKKLEKAIKVLQTD